MTIMFFLVFKKRMRFNKIQNYIPLYQKFFSLTDKTYNNINLNHKYNN